MSSRLTHALCAMAVAWSTVAGAAERYAVVISGASGGALYAETYETWRQTLVTALRQKFGYPDDHLFVLGEREADGVRRSTRENVQRVLGEVRRRATREDQVLIVLIGHGTSSDGEEAKFNLVGPDLTATGWAEFVKPIPARVVFVNTTAASFPFMRRLAGRGRVILTATDSAAQQYETVFAEYFVKALTEPAADFDKNGRVSIWEAFEFASAGVKDYFERKGQLPTERPVLDDNGDGIGREAQTPGPDGAVARVTYLDADAASGIATDTARGVLLKRRAELEAEVEAIKARKDTLSANDYDAQLEKALIELARLTPPTTPPAAGAFETRTRRPGRR